MIAHSHRIKVAGDINSLNLLVEHYFDKEIALLSHHSITRGSYISAHVLLYLFKELRKSDKMQGLQRV